MHPFLKDGKFIAFAHRGGALEAVENTLEAFEYAASLGYSHIETDVQATSDGVVVVFHDDELLALTGQPGRISDHTWAEVSKFKVHGTGRIPRFEDVLSALPEIFFNVDAKTIDVALPLSRLAKGAVLERLCLASEFEGRIKQIREEVGAGLCSAAPRGELARFLLPSLAGLRPKNIPADCLQVPANAYGLPLLTRATLGRAAEFGKSVHVWTIDNKEEMAQLAAKGVGGIMTDRPSVLKSVLEELDLW